MIDFLYRPFRHWSSTGSVYLLGDTHFGEDVKQIDESWLSPEAHIEVIKSVVHPTDTFIHLGDVGDPRWLGQIPGWKVLIKGNHDNLPVLSDYFHEVYNGPLFISDKILLSHEPILREDWFNIHGHDHNPITKQNYMHLNLASNVCGYVPVSLNGLIKQGVLSKISNIHRNTIDNAIKKKEQNI